MMTENKMTGMSLEEKEQFQLEKLQITLNRASRNVPFHRNRFQKSYGSSLEIKSIGEITKLPFMDRSHLGIYYPYGLFAVPLRDILRIHTAPGTGFNPTISGYTGADLMVWQDIISRALTAAGVTRTDIVQINLPGGLANWGRDYKDGGQSIGSSVIPNTPLSIDKTLMVLRDYKTTTLITTPSFARELADHMFVADFNPTGLNLKNLILVGEPADEETLSHLRNHFHAEPWIHYGLSEIPGPAVAFECEIHEGLHINDDFFLPEIIDPDTGKTIENGKKGELVLTTLSARAFPLIRFRTGDMARFIPSPCACGRPHTKIEWFSRRCDELMNISGVRVGKDQVMLHLRQTLGHEPLSCKIMRQNHGGRDFLEVHMAVDDVLFSDEIKNLEHLITTAGENVSEAIGVPVKIRLREK